MLLLEQRHYRAKLALTADLEQGAYKGWDLAASCDELANIICVYLPGDSSPKHPGPSTQKQWIGGKNAFFSPVMGSYYRRAHRLSEMLVLQVLYIFLNLHDPPFLNAKLGFPTVFL